MSITKADEIFSPLKGYPDYFVSNYGNVVTNRIGYHVAVLSHLNKRGYPIVVLCDAKGAKKTIPVYILVANYFVPKPENADTIIFKDKNILNHNAKNLRWVE
jgi:NUMOD4 motif